MAKTTVSGSFLAKLFPTMFQHFSENASQEDFNKAEQEAAVLFQQNQGTLDTPPTPPAAATTVAGAVVVPPVAAPVAEVVVVEATVTVADLQAQVGTLTTRATAAETERDTAKASLNTANTTIATLTPKAAAWDAHQAALKGSSVIEDSTNKGKTTPQASDLTEKDQKHLAKLQGLKAKYPGLMSSINVPMPKDE